MWYYIRNGITWPFNIGLRKEGEVEEIYTLSYQEYRVRKYDQSVQHMEKYGSYFNIIYTFSAQMYISLL